MLSRLKRHLARLLPIDPSASGVQKFWTRYNVSEHRRFSSAAESLEYFHWRNDQYFNYIDLMPVSGFDGKAILDFGCGPGHDLVGFLTYSKPARLVGVDVSATSIAEAADRVRLHGAGAETMHVPAGRLPFDDGSFDHIHASGVLHHIENLDEALGEIRRVLRTGGTLNVMVYNYDSLWLHLYVAYTLRILKRRYTDLDLRGAFARSTDSETCPISHCYRPPDFVALMSKAGFTGRFVGASMSMHEADLASTRFVAIQSQSLPVESREFLIALRHDDRGFLKIGEHYAGIGGCFHFTKS